MSENVSISGDDAASRIVLSAIAAHINDNDFSEKFADKGRLVEVTMTINGLPVNVVETLNDLWKRMDARLEERAKKIAVEMVTEAGLEPLAQALRDAELNIRKQLNVWEE